MFHAFCFIFVLSDVKLEHKENFPLLVQIPQRLFAFCKSFSSGSRLGSEDRFSLLSAGFRNPASFSLPVVFCAPLVIDIFNRMTYLLNFCESSGVKQRHVTKVWGKISRPEISVFYVEVKKKNNNNNAYDNKI